MHLLLVLCLVINYTPLPPQSYLANVLVLILLLYDLWPEVYKPDIFSCFSVQMMITKVAISALVWSHPEDSKICISFHQRYSWLVYQPVNIHFHTLWAQARDILWYPLVCKIKWVHMHINIITFPAKFWPEILNSFPNPVPHVRHRFVVVDPSPQSIYCSLQSLQFTKIVKLHVPK